MTLTTSHGFWIGMGGVVLAIAIHIGRLITKGKEPRQFGDEVQ